MGWVNDALSLLREGQQAIVRPFGGSMRGRIESGQLVTLAPVESNEVRIDDVVLVRWRDNYLLHLVLDIKEGQFFIGNNIGKTNGWVTADAIVARVIAIGDPLETGSDRPSTGDHS